LRIRLYQLAKELEVANKDLVAKCHEMGIDAKSHSSTVDDAQAVALRAAYGKAAAPAAAPAAPAKESAPAPKAPPKKGAPKGRAAKAPPAEAKGPAEPTAPRRREERREGAEIVRRIELPASDTTVRAYGPHVRIKDRRRPSGQQRRGRRPPRRTTRAPRSRRYAAPVVPTRPSKVVADYPVSLRSLSQTAGVKVDELMRALVKNGVMASMNEPLGDDVVAMLAAETGIEIQIRRGRDFEGELAEAQAKPDRAEDMRLRAPVVTLLGHVDHGKTSLLDAIRESHVVETESGGITQHIGAHTVRQDDRCVVFLDTPGHQAFTAMRARGAQVTDIVVLVVAADDGVMPQTQEAINHARAAKVPIVVAINKMDLPGANPQRVMQQLSALELLPAKWGGDTEVVEVSAVTKKGIPDLIETLAIQAEVLELTANPHKPATGAVLEAKLSEGRGAVATVLVQDGTLRVGDIVLCGMACGRARSLHDDRGRSIEEAGPSTPVEIAGLSSVPAAGDTFGVVDDLDTARHIGETRERRAREASLAERQHVTLETLFATLDEAEQKEVRVILKADVHGSLEVIRKALDDLSTDEVRVNLLHSAVGGVNESDILLADASDAVVIGFHVVADPPARALAEEKEIDVRLYNIIYNLTDDMKAALERRLEPERRETVVGHAEVRRVFRISRTGNVAGCYVTDGRIARSSFLRLTRDNVVVYEGKIGSLRHVKDDVRQVANGMECGIRIEGYDDVKEGDVIEAYEVTEIARRL